MIKIAILLSLPFLSFANDVSKISEALGHHLGKNIESYGVDFDLEALVKGLMDEQEGKTSPLTDEECQEEIAKLQDKKIYSQSQSELKILDVISNGSDLYDEDRPVSTTNSSEHR